MLLLGKRPLVAPAEHKARIEVGYGLEGTLTDALSNVIITGPRSPASRPMITPGGSTVAWAA
jgi:uncharacterized protein